MSCALPSSRKHRNQACSALTRFEARIGLVDDVDTPFTTDHPAVLVAQLSRLKRVADLHRFIPNRPKQGATLNKTAPQSIGGRNIRNPPRPVNLGLPDSDEIIEPQLYHCPHVSRTMGQRVASCYYERKIKRRRMTWLKSMTTSTNVPNMTGALMNLAERARYRPIQRRPNDAAGTKATKTFHRQSSLPCPMIFLV